VKKVIEEQKEKLRILSKLSVEFFEEIKKIEDQVLINDFGP